MTPDRAAAIARLYAQERAAWRAVEITGLEVSTEAANSALDAWERANAARKQECRK